MPGTDDHSTPPTWPVPPPTWPVPTPTLPATSATWPVAAATGSATPSTWPATQPNPLPAVEAADPGEDRRGVDRRTFLLGAAGVGVAGATALALTHRSWDGVFTSTSSAAPSASMGQRILVVATLYGGNDGLNTVIPYQDSAYLQARPSLGYQPDQVLPLVDGLALHPNLKGLKSLWDARKLAVVRGVGYPDPVLSHFRGMAIWQTGSPTSSLSTGVFGRWLDATGTDPMRAISVGATLPILLTGERSAATTIEGDAIRIPGGARLTPVLASFDAPGQDRPGLLGEVARSGSDLLSVQQTLANLLAGSGAGPSGVTTTSPAATATNGAGGARGGSIATLADQLAIVAELIKAGSPTKVYQVSMTGFDNHADEKGTHADLMTGLDEAVSGFMSSIGTSPEGRGVVLMTYSEFGRRVAQNASGGTDHGTAAPLFVVGPGVKGGRFYGEEPSLADLDDGNLNFTTDFRSVFATMLAEVVGVDPKVSLSGTFPTLDLI